MAKKRIFKTKPIIISIIFFSILISTLILPFLGKIYPNIYVANIYVGNKTKVEAVKVLKESIKIPEKIILNITNKKSEISTNEIIDSIDYESSIDRAYNFSSSGNYLSDFITKIRLIFKPTDLNLNVKFNEKNLEEILLISTSKEGSKAKYPFASKINGEAVIDIGSNGVEANLNKAKNDITRMITSGKNSEVNIQFKTIEVQLNLDEASKYKDSANKLVNKKIDLKLDDETVTIDDNELISFLKPDGFSDELIKVKILEISRKLNRSPQDSIFIIENGKAVEFTPSKDGIIVDEASLLKQIKDLPSEITIPVIKTSPKIKNEDVNDLGIDTILGRGYSTFKGSIPNRIHNVNLAQSKFKGVLIPPNETVSFNEILGDVSGLTGYKAAYVIMDGKTVLGDGGGVCQVSTTLFRAVLSAGLPVLERRAHAYRVGYYEQGSPAGLDATVYSPTTDFKFKNDTSAYLLIQPTIDLSIPALTFEIYGTNDGRVSTVSKPVITSSTAPAGDLYVDDPTLKIGIVKQIEHRAYGAKVIFDYKVTRNGEELINQKFVSNYRPWQAVYLRGTAPQ